jgi:group I intron endonuclease
MGRRLYQTLRSRIIQDDFSILSKNGIYIIWHIKKEGTHYVGSSFKNERKICKRGVYGRWIEHLCRLRTGNHHSRYLQNVVNKYGEEGLRFKMIEICEDVNECRKREQEWINTYNSYKKGYNMTPITDRPLITEKMKRKLSERMRLKNPMKCPLTRAKVSATVSDITSISVSQYTTEGKFIESYKNCDQAALKVGVDGSNIHRACSGSTKSSAGYIWIFTHEITEELLQSRINKYKAPIIQNKNTVLKRITSQWKPVNCYTLTGEFIKTYSSIKEAGKECGVYPGNISNCTSGKYKTAGGFVWKKCKCS